MLTQQFLLLNESSQQLKNLTKAWLIYLSSNKCGNWNIEIPY